MPSERHQRPTELCSRLMGFSSINGGGAGRGAHRASGATRIYKSRVSASERNERIRQMYRFLTPACRISWLIIPEIIHPPNHGFPRAIRLDEESNGPVLRVFFLPIVRRLDYLDDLVQCRPFSPRSIVEIERCAVSLAERRGTESL